MRITLVIAIIVLCPLAQAGTLQGRITDLFGVGRAGISVQYEVIGHDSNTSEPYTIQGPKLFSTSGPGANAGQFRVTIPDDKYRPNTKEVEILFVSDRLTPVKLLSLLGTAAHSLEVVMPALRVREQRSLEFPLFVLTGGRGTFHLLDHDASALFQSLATSRWHLSVLKFVDADDRFFYYDQDDDPDQKWAFARRPQQLCVRRGRRLVVQYGSWPVWVLRGKPPAQRWTLFEHTCQILPENGHSAKLGTMEVGKLLDDSLNRSNGEQELPIPIPSPPPDPKGNSEIRHQSPSDSEAASIVYRRWTSATGKSATVASLVEVDPVAGAVKLKKLTRQDEVTVKIAELCQDDQAYVAATLEYQLLAEL